MTLTKHVDWLAWQPVLLFYGVYGLSVCDICRIGNTLLYIKISYSVLMDASPRGGRPNCEWMVMEKDHQTFVCSNDKCKKVFDTPIVVHNLGLQNKYSACPSCLTEVLKKAFAKRGQKRARETAQTKEDRVKLRSIDPRIFCQEAQPNDCPYHFSYLSERSKEEAIPEECLLCSKVMDCMRQQ